MKNSFLNSLFVAALTAVACMLPANAQTSNAAINNITATQDALAGAMLDTLTASRTNGCSPRIAAATTKDFADALCKLQTAEKQAYEMVNIREKASQTMTSALAEKALVEAKAMGVSAKVRAHLATEWATAGTPAAALDAIGKLAGQSDAKMTQASQSGSFLRTIPSWLGGTTSYANYRSPRATVDEESRLSRIEKALGLPLLSTVTTVTK